jgi:hypothetical protein
MRNILFFLFLACGIAQAGVLKSFSVDTSSTSLATSYGTGASSLVVSGQTGARYVCVTNGASVTIAVNIDTFSATSAPSSPGTQNWYIPAGAGRCTDAHPETALYVYLRSASGSTISTGVITGEVWDRVQVP